MGTLLEMPVARIPRDWENDTEVSTFAKKIDEAWKQTGFVAVTGYDNKIAELNATVRERFAMFCALPLDVKRKHIIYNLPDGGYTGQRGYTEALKESSGNAGGRKAATVEWREHIMLGPRFSEDFPHLKEMRDAGFYDQNPSIPEVPGLVESAEELLDALEDLELKIFSAVAKVQGKQIGAYSGKLAYGNSSLRLHHYPRVPGTIERFHTVDNVNVLDVRISGPEDLSHLVHEDRLSDVFQNMLDKGQIEERGSEYILKNLVRADRHTDVDFCADLLGANKPGLVIETQTGELIRYTAQKGAIVVNGGDFAKHLEPAFPSSPHWVEYTPESAMEDRISIVRFTHPRPNEDVAGEPEGVRLYERLLELQYLPNREVCDMLNAKVYGLPSQEETRKRIRDYEKKHGLSKLTKYL